MVLDASAFALHAQFRPPRIAHCVNLPDGSEDPTIQKSTSPCGYNARNL